MEIIQSKPNLAIVNLGPFVVVMNLCLQFKLEYGFSGQS